MNRLTHSLPLYRAISTSVVHAFCASNPLLNAALHLACAPFILQLTRLALKMESLIARDGDLKAASQWLLQIGAADIRIHDADNVPATGPTLFVGNHAGLGDAHALLMASPRRDTKLMAHDFGILTGLRHFRRHVIIVDPRHPHQATRSAIRHLRAGGSLLLYPRGEIEPDPALYPDAALASLPHWSRSLTLFVRHVPKLAIAPVAVGGLISKRALQNPIVRRYRDRDRRHFLAATFQMLFPTYRDPIVSLHFGHALSGEEATYDKVIASMSALLTHVSQERHLPSRPASPDVTPTTD